jgi:hypothetical protein
METLPTTPATPVRSAAENAYISALSPKERAALAIAESHLATSFSLARSNGFLKWAARAAGQS